MQWPGRGPFLPMRFSIRGVLVGRGGTLYVRVTNQYIEVVDTGNPANQYVRLTNQYRETITPGNPANQYVRLTNQYRETVTPGNPANQVVRLTNQFREVVLTYNPTLVGGGSGNNNNGNNGHTKGPPPGKGKQKIAVPYPALNGGFTEYATRWTGSAEVAETDRAILTTIGVPRPHIIRRTKVYETGATHTVKEI